MRPNSLPRSVADDVYRPGFLEAMEPSFPSPRLSEPDLAVAFTLLPRFTLIAFAGFVDALRLAGDIGDRSRQVRCTWSLVGPSLTPVQSSCRVAFAHWETFQDPRVFNYIVVVGGLLREGLDYDPATIAYLRRAAAAGVPLVGLCTGSFVLAKAGVMKGYRACVHSYHEPDFIAEFPDIETATDSLYVVDRDRITCCGGAASIDLAGYLIARHCGRARALKILPHMSVSELRDANYPQLPLIERYFKVYDDHVRKAVSYMGQNLSEPLRIAVVARSIGASTRQVERAFRQHMGVRPIEYLRLLRLNHAHWFIVNTTRSIGQIAVDCGFADTSHMTRWFKRRFGYAPSTVRNGVQGRVAAG